MTDRCANAQFDPLSLGASCIQHPCSKNVEIEFADAPLHTQQQPVVWSTRFVHALQIDNPCLNETAQFKTMVLVTVQRTIPAIGIFRTNAPTPLIFVSGKRQTQNRRLLRALYRCASILRAPVNSDSGEHRCAVSRIASRVCQPGTRPANEAPNRSLMHPWSIRRILVPYRYS
jgi:hypothetical protein